MRNHRSVRVLVGLVALALPLRASAQAAPAASHTQIVFLGTGGPNPKPDKMGVSVAIIVNGTPYLVDAGTGLVRRASAASAAGVKGLEMPKLSRVFITHLHSDHTIGLPDLSSTPWIMGRTDPLQAYGPAGVAAMVDHLTQAYSADNDIRIRGLEHGNATGNHVVAHEIAPGVVYRDSNVTVKAFLVKHGSWPQAFGYRFETPDRTIVISGDTSPAESVAESCNGCDVLIHEAYTQRGYDASAKPWRDYVTHFHTSTYELAAIATKARPKTLILYHQMYFGGPSDTDAGMLQEIRSRYQGKVISARDLDVY
jgi:ribonuclease BN (tRNA processing enzyme)